MFRVQLATSLDPAVCGSWCIGGPAAGYNVHSRVLAWVRYRPYADAYYNRSCVLSSLDDKDGLGLPGLILRNGQVVLSTWFWRGETSAQMRCLVVPKLKGGGPLTPMRLMDCLLVTWCHFSRPADAGSECLKSGSAACSVQYSIRTGPSRI